MKNINTDTTAVKNAVKTAGNMIAGALILTILGASIWATINFDVLAKAVRYPEAVRQMEVEVLIIKK